MSSVILLSSSSFFLPELLTQKIKNNNYNERQFAFALKNNYIAALTIQEQSAELGSVNWLKLNRELAKTQSKAALKLARWYQKIAQQEPKKLLINKAIMWFEQAIRLHSQQAIVELAQLYFKHNELIKTQLTIKQLPKRIKKDSLAEAVLRLRLNIAIYLGEVDQVKQLLNSEVAKQHKYDETKRLLADIDTYAISKKSTLLSYDKSPQPFAVSSSCLTSLQLFATNLNHLKHLEQLVTHFKEQQPLAKYICLPSPRYISLKQLDCKAKTQQAISCDESRWQSIAKGVASRHIGLMLDEGGANVHLGVLYFDDQDSVEVFSHEVSHLLGFVDEYPLTKGHKKCQGVQVTPFSNNIAVLKKYYQGDKQKLRVMILKNISWANSIKADTPILQLVNARSKNKKTWRLGTPPEYQGKVGIYVSESCHNASKPFSSNQSSRHQGASYSAFKPLNRHTQLRYFANDFPSEYLTLIEENRSAYLMPSFHYNIALALYQQGKVSEARYWLNKAGHWESDPLRKAMILSGGF